MDYITLDEALSEELIEVVEVSEEGTVPELKVVNKSPCMILILDGEELVGGQAEQDCQHHHTDSEKDHHNDSS